MTGAYRLFAAADPPAGALDDLAAAVAKLHVTRVGARVTARALWHVTVAFIGDVPEERVPRAVAALERAVAARTAGAFELRLAGGGCFGRGRFAILWAGIDGDLPALTGLATSLRRQLRRERLPYDERRYRPHLTLSRPGDKVTAGELAEDTTTLGAYQGPAWRLDAVHLYRSFLGPHPRYERLATSRLPSDR